MAKYGNENAAAGGRSSSTADRDRGYGGGGGFGGDRPGQIGRGGSAFATRAQNNPMQDTAFGSGARGALYGGMGGLNARRTPSAIPSYDPSLSNLAKVATRAIPGAGMVVGAGLDIAGLRPGFSGYRGMVNGPGNYDPKNMSAGSRIASGGFSPSAARAALLAPPAPLAAPPTPQGVTLRNPFPVPQRAF